MTIASHTMINIGIAAKLAAAGYNVTLVQRKDFPLEYKALLESKHNVNVILEPKLVLTELDNHLSEKEIDHRLIQMLQKHNAQLKALHFDMIVTDRAGLQQRMIEYMEIPLYLQIMNGPAEQQLFIDLKIQPAMSPHYTLVSNHIYKTEDILESDSLGFRMANKMAAFWGRTFHSMKMKTSLVE